MGPCGGWEHCGRGTDPELLRAGPLVGQFSSISDVNSAREATVVKEMGVKVRLRPQRVPLLVEDAASSAPFWVSLPLQATLPSYRESLRLSAVVLSLFSAVSFPVKLPFLLSEVAP